MAEQKKEKTPSTETKAREKLYDFKFMESLLGGDWPLFIECVKEAKFTTADFRKWLQASDNEEIFDASDPIWTLVAVNDKPSFTASSAVIATTASSGNSASSSSSSK